MEGHQASHGPAVMSTRGPRSVLGFEKHVRLSWRWIGWTGLPRVRCSEVTRKQDSCPRRHSADAADAGPLPKALGSERWAQVKVGLGEGGVPGDPAEREGARQLLLHGCSPCD